MTVDQLREALAEMPGHYDIAMESQDSAGNPDLKYADSINIVGAAHVFVVIR